MKYWLTGSLMGFVFILVSQAAFGEELDGVLDLGTQDEKQIFKLFYVFSLDDLEHQAHSRELQILTRQYGRRLKVTGIVRPEQGGAINPGSLEAFRIRNGLSYELLSTSAAKDEPGVPAELKERFNASSDYVLLVDLAGEFAVDGVGRELAQILSGLALEPIRTEVDETTWGKIKVLFN